MHASNPPTVESRSFWSRRWPALLALGAGLAVDERAALDGRGFLFGPGEPQVGWQLQLAGIGCDLAAQQQEQAGFAGAIGANKADMLAGMQGEIHVAQQLAGAAAQGQLGESNHDGGHFTRGVGPMAGNCG